ncbi:MAG: hypothetical protein IJR26_07510 [Bacteroidales bacterium]|nr:hypothetical protein [Bacteroidales bacterium]
MKDKAFFSMMMAVLLLLQSCGSVTDESVSADSECKYYNVCIILDGTDRLSQCNSVPRIGVDEIVKFARTISEKGKGALYVGYVDKNCDNNSVAMFEWSQDRPSGIGKKPDYMPVKEYEKQKRFSDSIADAYRSSIETAVMNSRTEITSIHELAYSDFVAQQSRGSDVNGAINQAIRLLRASDGGFEKSYIVLVSDGADNVGKPLNTLPESIELLIVNANNSKHQYGSMVSKELVTLTQAFNYIFK